MMSTQKTSIKINPKMPKPPPAQGPPNIPPGIIRVSLLVSGPPPNAVWMAGPLVGDP
jgi:hypothetical protein